MPTRLTAPAKLTTSLRVVGVRPDGLHLIDAEMISVSLFDEIEISDEGVSADSQLIGANAPDPRTTLTVSLDDPALKVSNGNAALRGAMLDNGPGNLVLRALGMVGRSPREVSLLKRIPAGAGLGGGSADAGAILRWAGSTDAQRAAELGADVPFCAVGGRARVQGIGELIDPLPFEEQVFTLAVSGVICSTPRVYAKWDEMGGPVGEQGNDLEAAAIQVAPELQQIRDKLGELSGRQPRLAGSGSTWFVEGAFEEAGIVVSSVPADRDGEHAS